MRTRLAVAVLLPGFPPVTEAFVVHEIEELERQGQPVLAVPLLRERSPVVEVLAANLRTLVRTPGRYAGLLGRLIVGMAWSPGWLLRTLALVPQSVYLADRLREAGVGHLHAHVPGLPATVAYVVSFLTGIGYSVTAHAQDVFEPHAFLLETLRRARFVRTTSQFNPVDPDPDSFRLHVSELLARLDGASEPVPAELSRPLEGFAWDGQAARALGVRRVHERADSTVVEVLVSEGRRGRDVVFKVQRAHPAGERARLEFDVLSLLAERFAGCPGYGVPLPLGLDETVAAVLMEPCRGRPLDALVREARASRAPAPRIALESALRRTGGWLRLFQSHTARPGEGGRALEALWARARRDLDACTGRALAPPSAARIAERLDGLAARVAGEALRVVGRQGTSGPGTFLRARTGWR